VHSPKRWSDMNVGHTVGEMFRSAVDHCPDRSFMTIGDERATYAQMLDRATAVANSLHSLGVGPQDVVALQAENSMEFLDIYLGASLLGAIIAPINFHHRGTFLSYQLNLVRAKVLVVDASRIERLTQVVADVPSLRHVFVNHDPRSIAGSIDLPGYEVLPTATLRAGTTGRTEFAFAPRWDDPNIVLFTSGTTGPSKAGIASHNYMVGYGAESVRAKGGCQDDVFWTPLPMYHGNALFQTVLGPMAAGASAALDARFSVSRFWDRVRALGATQVSILGAQFVLLWNQAPRTDDQDNPVRCMFGAPLPADIHRGFEERFGVQYVTAYGLGEAMPLLQSTTDDPPPPGTAGKPSDRFEVRLVDDADRDVPDGEIGELVCRPRAPHVMFEGYLNDPDATLRSYSSLWFHTGDYLRRRSDGWFEFVDRKKDAIRRRGENVSSWEVEQALLTHPLVAEVAAFAVPSDLSEDEIMVVVVLEPGSALAPETLADHCVANMPYFAVPRFVRFADQSLTNDLGKTAKFELRAVGVTADTWDRESSGYVVAR
jgi:carnitine-CoA ligase